MSLIHPSKHNNYTLLKAKTCVNFQTDFAFILFVLILLENKVIHVFIFLQRNTGAQIMLTCAKAIPEDENGENTDVQTKKRVTNTCISNKYPSSLIEKVIQLVVSNLQSSRSKFFNKS